jgi:hypothetical protein
MEVTVVHPATLRFLQSALGFVQPIEREITRGEIAQADAILGHNSEGRSGLSSSILVLPNKDVVVAQLVCGT